VPVGVNAIHIVATSLSWHVHTSRCCIPLRSVTQRALTSLRATPCVTPLVREEEEDDELDDDDIDVNAASASIAAPRKRSVVVCDDATESSSRPNDGRCSSSGRPPPRLSHRQRFLTASAASTHALRE
jgi:hypothetical protein